MSIQSVTPSNHLILCRPLLLLPSIFPNIRVFSNESALHIRWPKYWSFSFSISPSSEYSGLISFRMDWLYLLAVQETLKSLLQHHSSKASIFQSSLTSDSGFSLVEVLVAQSYPILYNSMDHSMPASSVHGILQARILEWGASFDVLTTWNFCLFVCFAKTPVYPAAAAAAAKSLQSCPTLCDPRDGSPPGYPIPAILQARTLEWVAISFSNA